MLESTEAMEDDPGENDELASCPIFDDPFRLFDEWSSEADGAAFDGQASSQ